MIQSSVLKWLSEQPKSSLLLQHGVEKEGLRVDSAGHISQSDHPEALGSALTHPAVTTDYAESLLEFITPVTTDPEQTLKILSELHQFALAAAPDEVIWPASMPAVLAGEESVRIAEYGQSHLGRLKHVYRQGLWHRYGRIMQTIAGVHFNFSMPEDFWQPWQTFKGSKQTAMDFRSAAYFGLMRQFRRHAWLPLYLFGASPAVDRSFLNEHSVRMSLLSDNTYVMHTATSLRMSDLGYSNAAQQSLKVCFNNLPSYIRTLHTALHTGHPPYAAIGLGTADAPKQLNTNVLQIENEYYSDIRPKRTTLTGEKPIAALHRAGVEYVEIRCLDLNPYLPLGMDADQLRFMGWFLLWCLLSDSTAISDVECERLSFNQRLTVLHGRDPELKLVTDDKTLTLRDWGRQILSEMRTLVAAVEPVDAALVRQAIDRYQSWLESPNLTPSGQMCLQLQDAQVEYRDLVQNLAQSHRETLTATPLDPKVAARMVQEAADSVIKQAELEAQSQGRFVDYVEQFLGQTEHLALADESVLATEVLS